MKTLAKIFFLSVCALTMFSTAWAQTATDVTLHVDIQNPEASDANPGSELRPFKTIQAATTAAMENNKGRVSTKILISPGTYRESIQLGYNGQETDAPIIFEAKTTGTAIISGSEVWGNWQRGNQSNIYIHPWPYRWGLAPYPAGWEGWVTLQPILRRREMIFVNGTFLLQVLTQGELVAGSFFVSESEGLVYVFPPAGTNMETATVEVAIRPQLLLAEGKRFLTLRGLTFTHGNAAIQAAAVTFNNSSEFLIENSRFDWNNWSGIGTNGVHDVVVRNSIFNNNGGIGSLGWKMKDILFEGNTTNWNNWRGAQVVPPFDEWGVAGLKHLLVHKGIYRNHTADGNYALGFWLDTDCVDVLIENSRFCENLTGGMFLEANQGPQTLRGNLICNNRGSGLLIGNSTNGLLEKNIFYHNHDTQIRLGGAEARPVTDWETNQTYSLLSKNWVWRNNAVTGTAAQQLFVTTLSPPLWDPFQTSFTSDSNVWFRPGGSNGFVIPGGDHVDLAGWKSTTGEEANSSFADPQFLDPTGNNFSVASSSPLVTVGGWTPAPNSPSQLTIQPIP
jgi:parallel beta-helix repeat protein